MLTFIVGFVCGDIATAIVLLFFMGANSQHHPRISNYHEAEGQEGASHV